MIQTTPDTGAGARLGAFESRVNGIGPMLTYTLGNPKDPLTFIAKYYKEFDVRVSLSISPSPPSSKLRPTCPAPANVGAGPKKRAKSAFCRLSHRFRIGLLTGACCGRIRALRRGGSYQSPAATLGVLCSAGGR
jgi:hypothetical protein